MRLGDCQIGDEIRLPSGRAATVIRRQRATCEVIADGETVGEQFYLPPSLTVEVTGRSPHIGRQKKVKP